MQAPEVVEVPLPRIVASEASVVFIVRIEGQLELLADIDAFVTKG